MDDEILRARFRSLADEDARHAPPLTEHRLAAHRATLDRRRRRHTWRLAGAVAVVGAAAGAVFVAWPRSPEPWLDLSIAAWTAPSDFLLETPGSVYLRSLPAIGVPASAAPAIPAVRSETSRRNQ